jgi:hypothetical protein
MVAPVTWLPQLYQRYRSFWDRVVPAAGLALLLWATTQATATFPGEWRVFLAAVLLLLGLVRPDLAYVAFIFAVAYPLYSVSIYLAAIILAALILTSHWAMRNLGATVLVLATPALLPWHLEAAVPLLAGLWWGEVSGALAGGLAALWLKLLAGMASQPLDLIQLSGWAPAGTRIVQRFGGFNSLQTLLELVNPFADTSQTLLLHVLQALSWGLAGYLAGRLAQRVWSDRWRGWAPLLSAAPAAGVLWVSYVLLARLLTQPEAALTRLSNDLPLWLLSSALASAALRHLYLHLRRPVPRPLHHRSRRKAKSAPQPSKTQRAQQPASPPGKKRAFNLPDNVNWRPSERPRPATEADDDVIMLEID